MYRALAAVACIGLAALVQAGDIYRWMDENGRTHFADSVPEKYKGSATKVEPLQPEPTEAERRQAVERAALERARAAAAASESARSGTSATAQPTPAGQSRGGPARDCEIEHQRYRESIDCFSRFMTQSGAVRAEAFQHCSEVKDPSVRCGPPKPESTERTYVNPGSARTY